MGFLLGSCEDIRRYCRIWNASLQWIALRQGQETFSPLLQRLEWIPSDSRMSFFSLTACFDPSQTGCPDFYDKLSLTAHFFQLHWLTFPLFTQSVRKHLVYSRLLFTAVQHTHTRSEHHSLLSLSLATSERQTPESISTYLLLRDKQSFLLGSRSPHAVCLTNTAFQYWPDTLYRCLHGIPFHLHSK